ncbi:hypothetical protein NPIL_35791 [Nephila pilipes]|uniref:Uncharacterized protein n=1 Tax=Nephila pilipes TaxID=299642 RepID=A0A8X6QNF0_NEPPI|nr:hypothetical protein NPIL_35791 [Nephila pilipes]
MISESIPSSAMNRSHESSRLDCTSGHRDLLITHHATFSSKAILRRLLKSNIHQQLRSTCDTCYCYDAVINTRHDFRVFGTHLSVCRAAKDL